MILNVSYNNKAITQTIDEAVGKPFPLMQRLKMGGIGSPRLVITEASVHIQNLLMLDNNRDVCNIEMRPNGILVGFRSLLESYVLLIPYYKLVLYKGKGDEYSIYKDQYFIKVAVRSNDKNAQKFMSKLLQTKAECSPVRIEDL